MVNCLPSVSSSVTCRVFMFTARTVAVAVTVSSPTVPPTGAGGAAARGGGAASGGGAGFSACFAEQAASVPAQRAMPIVLNIM
jgi:hypothetical protein